MAWLKSKETIMRFMVQVRSNPSIEAGAMPDPDILEAMGKFNETLIAGGHMLAGEGLKDSSFGARMTWSKGKITVTDGPFAETKELIAGFWLVDFPSKAALIEAFMDCPGPAGDGEGVLEVRQVFEAQDFEGLAPPEDIIKEQAFRDAAGHSARS